MPRLDDHGLGGGGKSIGVPIYPFNMSEVFVKDETGNLRTKYGDAITAIPEEHYATGGCALGDEMYLMGMMNNKKACYKYNVKSKVWTKLADTTLISPVWAVSSGYYVYYCETAASNYIYRYHTLNNTHNQISNKGSYPDGSRATINGNYIYRFGGNRNSSYYTLAERISISDGSFTKLTAIPVEMYNHTVVNGGDGYIYLFGGQANSTKAYKYSINYNSYTAIADIPFNHYGGMGVRIDNYIYLINSVQSTYKQALYAYDILTNTYTSLGNTPKARQYGVADVVNGDVYMIGGGTSATTYLSGESVRIGKFKTLNLLHQRLTNGCKVYTDGDINTGTVTNKVFEQATTVEKVNGVATIPADNEYFLVGANYATIGG